MACLGKVNLKDFKLIIKKKTIQKANHQRINCRYFQNSSKENMPFLYTLYSPSKKKYNPQLEIPCKTRSQKQIEAVKGGEKTASTIKNYYFHRQLWEGSSRLPNSCVMFSKFCLSGFMGYKKWPP